MNGERILIIDDDAAVLDSLSLVLHNLGHFVLTANNGKRGVQLAEEESPDVIILDLMMPKQCGFQVLQQLKFRQLDHIPLLVISACTANRSQSSVKELGADSFLAKPFSMDQLLEELSSLSCCLAAA